MRIKKTLALWLLVTLVFNLILPFANVAYASSYYETNKDNVSVFSDPYQDSQRLKTYGSKGSLVKVHGSIVNTYDNVWYEVDGGYIYSGHLDKHTKHKGAKCAPNGGQWYDNINNVGHTLVIYEGDHLCACGTFVDYGTKQTFVENHEYSGDVCVDCGYQKSHSHVGAKCASNSSKTFKNINDDTHTIVFYEGDILCECNEFVEKGATTEQVVAHNFSGEFCIDCGYQKVHQHNSNICEDSVTTYENITNETHDESFYSGMQYCSCGKLVSAGYATVTTEKHDFSNNTCTECGYHVHKGVSCAPNGYIIYEDIIKESHTVVFYEGDHLCSCGVVVAEGEFARTKEAHDFSNDVCTKCGYGREHVHKASKCAPNNYTKYENITESGHTAVYYEGDHLCGCGAFVKTGNFVETPEEHVFYNNVCISCGYEKVKNTPSHEHKAVSCAPNSYTIYEDIVADSHTFVFYEGDHLCSCGEVVENGNYIRSVDAHDFVNDTCIKCSYVREHEHIGSKCVDSYSEYIDITISTHTEIAHSGKIYCKCNVLVSEGNVTTFVESHTFENDICIECGYQRNFNESVESVINQVILGDISEESTPIGLVGEVLLGELPIVGTLADVRDLTNSIVNYESPADVILNASGIFPIIGSVKYTDEVYTITKHSEDISDILDETSEEVIDTYRYIYKASDEVEGFSSYKKFKSKYGKAGDGMHWHHIVEQSQIKRSGFSSEMINNTYNIVAIDAKTHRKITAHYNRKIEGLNMSVRDWITSQNMPFEEQYNYGIQVMEQLGVKVK